MLPRILSEICAGIWLIDKQKAQGYLPIVASLIKGNFNTNADDFEIEKKLNSPKLISVDSSGIYQISEYGIDAPPEDAPENSIAIISVKGVITKYDQFCGPSGTATKKNILKRAAENDNIISIILDIDTPGGEGAGTQDFSQEIKNTKKPVIAFVSDQAASAGYWIASAADHIVLNVASAEVGSIGAYTTIIDYTGYFEQMGINIKDIYAKQSVDKNRGYREAVDGNTELLENQISEYCQFFINDVKNNRQASLKSKEDIGTGKMYFAKEAVEIGLADSIGSFDHAIKIASDYGKKTKLNNNAMKKIQFKNTWNNIAAFFGYENIDGKELSEEDVDKLNAEMQISNDKLASAISEKNQLAEKITAMQTEIESLNEENKKLSEKLEMKPAKEVASVTKEKDDIQLSNDGVDWETLNSLPHMKEAEKLNYSKK